LAAAPEPAPALSLHHPATLVALLVTAACIVFSVTYRLIDSDFWQHLLVGKVIWTRGMIPRQHLWSWTSYGRSEVLPSWLFRWLLWPFYDRGGVPGLFVWRWITTLAAFGFAWATARHLGARGFAPLVVLAWCALVYRSRSQVRPETLAAVLLTAELWILERARNGDRRALPWLVPITWIWVNAHVSYFIAFVLIGLHGVAAGRGWGSSRTSAAPRGARSYLWVAIAMAAAAFANPFGWSALWQPFDYALHLSREPLFRGIGELQPVSLGTGWRYGLWIMVIGWPLLMLLRAPRHGLDKVEAITAALVTAYALPSQRFLGVYALVAAPYLARDLETWIRDRRWPAWTRPAAARAALASVACIGLSIPEWSRPLLRPGIGVEMERFPVAACDWIERHGIRGHGFEHFRFVGYQAWRFWPDRGRLPFMDIHQSGTPQDRAAFASAFTDPSTWSEITRRYRLDYALLDRRQRSGTELLDAIDADTTWTLAFLDDVSALYLDRVTLGAAADSLGFHALFGSAGRLAALASHADNPKLQGPLRADLERAVRESRQNATAHFLLASLDMATEHLPAAAAHLRAALAVDPSLPQAHLRLAMIALEQKRPQEAIADLEFERAANPDVPGIDVGLGMAYRQLGASERARRSFESALARDPGNDMARAWLDSLAREQPH
jgi:hypothetical protein